MCSAAATVSLSCTCLLLSDFPNVAEWELLCCKSVVDSLGYKTRAAAVGGRCHRRPRLTVTRLENVLSRSFSGKLGRPLVAGQEEMLLLRLYW